MDWLKIAEIIGLIIFVGVGVFGSSWYKILKETNNLLKEQNNELRSENRLWQQKHEENVKAISKLQGEVNTLKNVPLKDISQHMQRQTEVSEKLLVFLENNFGKA